MKNYAGAKDNPEVDAALVQELTEAGIQPHNFGNRDGEVGTKIGGQLGPWVFNRAWYYWVCEGPGLPIHVAEELHSKFGKEVRVHGHCGCPSPSEWNGSFGTGSYHVDTQEGLNALAEVIRTLTRLGERTIDDMVAELKDKDTLLDHEGLSVVSIDAYDNEGNVAYTVTQEACLSQRQVQMDLSMFRRWSFIGTKNFF